MEIQWMMFAKGYIQNKADGTSSIVGIFHHINTYLLPDGKADMMLITKVKPDVTEVGETKIIRLEISHIQKDFIIKHETKYQVHDLTTWATRVPYIIIPIINIDLPFSGEYSFKLYVDGDYKNEESLTVDKEEKV